MSKGILIVAVNHSNYGKMAQNLAISIKSVSPDVKITLACDYKAGKDLQYKNVFDKIVNVPMSYYTNNGLLEAIKVKTFLYNLSPYKETIYLDADMVWNPYKTVEQLFDECDSDFLIKNTGKVNLDGPYREDWSWWTPNLSSIKKAYKLKGDYYSLSSEVIYFKKNKHVKKIFDTAKSMYNFKGDYLPFAGGVPDELLYSVALCKLGISMKTWIPSYWEESEKRYASRKDIFDNYYLYSIGGKQQNSQVKKVYNDLVQAAYKKVGYVHPFLLNKATEKRVWLPERTHI